MVWYFCLCYLSVVHILEGGKAGFGFCLGITVTDKEHGDKAHGYEEGCIGEEDAVAHIAQQEAGHNGGDDLRGHGCGVIEAGELADIGAAAHFNNHGQGVYVDGSPCKTHKGKDNKHDDVDGVIGGGQHIAQSKADCQQDNAELDGLFAAYPGSNGANGNVGHYCAGSGHQQTGGRAAQTLTHDNADIGGKPGGNAVVACKPQGDGSQQEAQGALDLAGQHIVAGAVILCQIPLGVLGLQGAVFGAELGLFYGDEKHRDCHEHDGRDHDEQGLVIYMGKTLSLGVGVHDGCNDKVQQTANRAHQIDDGVALGAQGLGGNIGHQRHSGGAVCAHGNQQQTQHDDKGGHLEGAGCACIAIVQQGQHVEQDDGAAGAEENIGHALAYSGACPVGQAAKEGQQEQRKNVIRRHDGTGDSFIQMEGVGEDERHNAVIHLPEGADGQKSKTHQKGPFIVKFHS